MQLTVKLELLQLPLLLLLLQFLRLVERRGREELKIASALAASQLLVREPPITGQHFRMLAGWLSAYYHRLTTTVSQYQQQQWPSLSEHCCCVLELVHGCMQIRLRREDIKSSQQKNTYVQLAIRRLTSYTAHLLPSPPTLATIFS